MTAVARRTGRIVARRRVRSRGLLADMLEGVAILDAEWRYRYVNPAAARQAGMRPDELVGRRVQDLFPGVEQTDIFERWSACMATGRPQRFRGSYRFPDGAAWYDFSVRRVEAGIFVLSLDVTHRANAEAEMRRAWETRPPRST